MTRLSRIFTAVALVLAAILLFVMVNQIVDRCSHHEDTWAREFTDMPSEKISKAD